MKKSEEKLLIFDIDGVLVDVTGSYREAAKQTAEFFTKKRVTLQEIQAYKNKGGFINDWNLTEAIIKNKGFSIDKEKIINKFQEYYSTFKKNEKWILDKNLLNELSKSYKLAVFTGRPRNEAVEVLKNNNAFDYFICLVAMEDVEKEKPDPEGLIKIIKILSGFKIKDALYFGDTIDDMKAALSSNVKGIGVLPPSDKSEKLRNLLLKNGAKAVIEDINQIRSVLE